MLNFTLYGEYEALNEAALYEMEVAGFGGEDLEEPLAQARRTSVRTLELRAIAYHDWGRVNLTFNFISETPLQGGGNDFGYAWGVFRKAPHNVMETDRSMAGMAGMPNAASPPALSFQRLGYGLEMMGALGNADQFGFHWQRQQHYLGPVLRHSVSKRWAVALEPSFGLSDVSDPGRVLGAGHAITRRLRQHPEIARSNWPQGRLRESESRQGRSDSRRTRRG